MSENEKCVPCSSSLPPMTIEESRKSLQDLPDWELTQEGKAIERHFGFKNFAQAMEFAVKVGQLAEKMGHHPVLTLGWGFCKVRFKTSKINGLHKNDFVMASHVSRL